MTRIFHLHPHLLSILYIFFFFTLIFLTYRDPERGRECSHLLGHSRGAHNGWGRAIPMLGAILNQGLPCGGQRLGPWAILTATPLWDVSVSTKHRNYRTNCLPCQYESEVNRDIVSFMYKSFIMELKNVRNAFKKYITPCHNWNDSLILLIFSARISLMAPKFFSLLELGYVISTN